MSILLIFNVLLFTANMTKFGPKIVTTLPKEKRFQEGDAITMKCAAAGRYVSDT
jgi:hypothetical protein